MQNKNYPQMFDEQIANPEFLDSLHSIAKEPLSHKISSGIEPLRLLTGAVILLFYGNNVMEALFKIYFYYAEQINIKIVNIQIASSYAKDIANYLLK
ncbi:MAG: hypothetical protein HOL62_02160 [Candidatus Marinimicrobia bacterium]|jgi:hypothetical protein|nr:hypothetical protein [Gammaproteobacteria bacterium]MBT3727970.1 hypothetical protein [Candidatus Neomarinimicrobiota bacterium]MBT3944000.1 hypothetical protein [Candidatus Neomarinimicrobiota bacterium]MBT4316736.1 hypothetical protein [Candidatus Neomarinimicrobiota bacterium]MBT4707153.1 hypothetical protein [Candidatus Neomarinimicrobiota bacterium]